MADPIIVESTDGQRFEFPAGTDRLTMKRAIDEHYRSTAVGQGGAPVLPRDSTKTPDKWSPQAVMQDRFGPSPIPGADRLRTQGVKGVADAIDFADMVNPIAVPVKAIGRLIAPEFVNSLSGGQIIRRSVFDKARVVPETDATSPEGKIFDAAVRAAAGSAVFPGSFVRNAVPALVGGGMSEAAGQATAGTNWETPVRVAAGLVGGVGAAGVQAAGGAAIQGAKNLRGAPAAVDDTAARIAGRALERDKLTPQQMLERMKNLGDDAMPVDAGGENLKGALRGSIAAPGQARTTVANVFADRAEKEGARVGATIDRNVSPKGLTQTVDDISRGQAKASGAAYEAAGIPRDPKAFAQAPQLQGDAIKALITDSADVQAAIAAARRLPDYKNLPDTSMVLLDKAYKHIGGMEREAVRAGNGARAYDLGNLRKSLAEAIDAENPKYGDALRAFSEPAALKDAAELGAKLFGSNARPDAVRAQFAALPDDAKDAFLVGVAEHLRKTAGTRDASGVAGRVVPGPDARERLAAVLGKEQADALFADLAREKTFTRTARDVGIGSRTTPMGLEAQDNAAQAAGAIADVARGRFVNALSRATGRLTEGRTERVNARVAEILTSMKPEEQTAFINALEQTMARQRLRAPSNAFRAGAGAPLPDSSRERK